MAEWLRRQPAKLMGYARVGSNPTVVVFDVATLIQLAVARVNSLVEVIRV